MKTLSTATMVMLVLVSMSTSAFAQECQVGVYLDDEGTSGIIGRCYNPNDPLQPLIVDIYTVAFVEDEITAMAYKLVNSVPAIVIGGTYGPSGLGSVVTTEDGEFIELGECADGFGGKPVVIAHYEVLIMPGGIGGAFCLVPNAGQDPATDPTRLQYRTCSGPPRPCNSYACVLAECWLSSGSVSFSAVKALF